jgi:hypothetical protein
MNAAAMFERCLAHQQGDEARDLPIEMVSRGYEHAVSTVESLPVGDRGREDAIPIAIEEAIP